MRALQDLQNFKRSLQRIARQEGGEMRANQRDMKDLKDYSTTTATRRIAQLHHKTPTQNLSAIRKMHTFHMDHRSQIKTSEWEHACIIFAAHTDCSPLVPQYWRGSPMNNPSEPNINNNMWKTNPTGIL